MRAAALAVLFATGCTSWTRADTAAQLAVTATLAIDYRQTRQALDEGARERNPLMAPGRLSPEVYFPAVAIACAGTAAALPRPWRGILQGTVFAVQVDNAVGNWVRFGRVW